MKLDALVRDASMIESSIAEVGDRVIAKRDLQIVIPYDYLHHKLAKMGAQIYTAAIAAIVVGESYAVLNACAMINITPDQTNQIKIGGEEMLSFSFNAGSVIMTTMTIVKDSDLAYEINRYFYSFGRVPWFMNYRDVGQVLKMHKEYSGLNISPNNVPFEIQASKVCRDAKDKFVFYRHTDMSAHPVVIPFQSVMFNASSTTAKIIGNYLDDGVTSALLSPSTKTETVENLLRA